MGVHDWDKPMCDCDRELQELESCSDFCSIVRARPLKVLTKLPSWPVLPVLKPCKECGQAREVELSESAIRKLPKNNSLLARLVGKLTK